MMDMIISNLKEKTQPSPDLVEALVCDLEKRLVKNPSTLKKMSIQCILENKARFLSDIPGHYNPLSKLPNLIVQELLAEIRAVEQDKEPVEQIFAFLLQLLNPHILTYDHFQFSQHRNHFAPDLFRHLLHKCPKIQKMHISLEMWETHGIGSRPTDLFRVMACKWENLTYLKLDNIGDEAKSDYLLEIICSCFPKLVGLEVYLDLNTLTMEGVKHLQKMEKLQTLQFGCIHIQPGDLLKCITTLVHAIGQIPFLQKFAMLNGSDHLLDATFVDLYGELYPQKKLTVQKIRLSKDLKRSWPDCLSLEELNIAGFGRNDDSTYENLLNGNCKVKKFHCDELQTSVVYSLVEKFGPAGLTHLSLSGIHHATGQQPLDASRVLAACPEMEHVEIFGTFMYSGNYSEDVSQVPLENFKNCTHFILNRGHFPEADAELYAKYFLGSRKVIKEMEVDSFAKYEGVCRVLELQTPSCLDHVEKISLFSDGYINETLLLENVVLKVVLPLLERSPCLKAVDLKFLMNTRYCDILPNWLLGIFERLGITVKYAFGLIRIDECRIRNFSDYDDGYAYNDNDVDRGSDYDYDS